MNPGERIATREREQHVAATIFREVNRRETADAGRRFRLEVEEEPKTVLRNLKPEAVNTLFGWTQEIHKKKTNSDPTLGKYWLV